MASFPAPALALVEQMTVAAAAERAAEERPAPQMESRDAPFCYACGNIMQRAGSCYACPSCGATSGCS
jgi:ribonucleoside-diphosphate reductase alpha chain